MATMVSEIYDAFIEAGASQEKARRAAEAIAAGEARTVRLEGDLRTDMAEVKREVVAFRGEFNRETTSTRGEMNLLRWMVGTNMALTVAVLAKLLFLPS